MSEKKKIPKYIKTLSICSGIAIILIVSLSVYSPTIAKSYLRKEPHTFSFNFSDIQYIPEEIQSEKLPTIEIFPKDYETIISALGKDIPQYSKVELLRYSQTLLKTENITNLKEAYQYLKDKNLPVVIPQEYINIFMINEAYQISQKIKHEITDEDILYAFNFQTHEYTNFNTCKNTSVIDITTDCNNMITSLEKNFNINSTLPILYNWILFTDYKTDNGYNKYIHEELKDFSLYRDYKENSISMQEIPSEIYWDTDINTLKKLEYLFEYLKRIYLQSEIDNKDIKKEINENIQEINNLISMDSSQLNILAQKILGSSILNDNSQTQIYLDWKILNSNSTQKSYVLPMYIYKENTEYKIKDNNFNEAYDYSPVNQDPGTVRVPILMYHQISKVPEGSSFIQGLYITPEIFEKQIAYLVKMNYKTISSKELYDLLLKGVNPSQKTVILTFDDSVKNHYTTAYPILKKYGLTGTFFVVSNRSGITYPQLKEMSDNGMEIASHTSTHIDLKKETDDNAIKNQIFGSKAALQYATGKTVYSIAYPGCVADSRTFDNVAQAGYLTGMSCGRRIDHRFSGRLSLSRIHVFNNMNSFIQALSGIN